MTPVACVPYREARWLRDTSEPRTLKHTHTGWHNGRGYDQQSDSCWEIHSHIHANTQAPTFTDMDTQTNTHKHTHTYMTNAHSHMICTYMMTNRALPVTKGRSTDDISVELWPVPVTHRGPHTIIEHLQSAFILTAAANQSYRGCGCDAYKDMKEEQMCSQLVLITWYSDSPATLKMELCHWNWFECVNVFVMQSFKHTLKQHPR